MRRITTAETIAWAKRGRAKAALIRYNKTNPYPLTQLTEDEMDSIIVNKCYAKKKGKA